MGILVIDLGSSSVRASVVDADGTVAHTSTEAVLPTTPVPSFVEYDAEQIANAVVSVARKTLGQVGHVDGVGIADQRATTVLWERSTGKPVGPAISWQDLRTVGTCLILKEQGILLAPNESATKLAFLLDLADPERSRDLCFGTMDTWVAWTLSGGSLHVMDASNAGVTGLRTADGAGWDKRVIEALKIPESTLPTIVDSSGLIGEALALEGAPPICGILGDQQASLVGQGCTQPGLAKITFGTGGFLDCCVGTNRPDFARRGKGGTFPITAWQRDGEITWGTEAVILSAGTCVEWLRDDIGIIPDAASTDAIASSVKDSGDVWFVPALFGLGTPVWDFGARGTFVGITRGTGRAEMVRAVLDGIAHRGADLIEATEKDTGYSIESVRVDGGMSANETFLRTLADVSGRRVEVAPLTECTTLGAAYMAGIHLGVWRDEADIASNWHPRQVLEPRIGDDERAVLTKRWAEARNRSAQTVPELSTVQFWDA
jgi:glycerol kinase